MNAWVRLQSMFVHMYSELDGEMNTVGNWGKDTESKTSPRHLNFLKQLNKAIEIEHSGVLGLRYNNQGAQ